MLLVVIAIGMLPFTIAAAWPRPATEMILISMPAPAMSCAPAQLRWPI
jgi:hypothetical protein